MASKLENCMFGLIAVFHKYSGKEGDKYKLNKTEVKNLFQNEFGGLPEGSDDPRAGDIMKRLDMDGDGEVDFEEFCLLVAQGIHGCKKSADKSAGKPLSDLQKAMKGVSEVFEDYAGKEGDKTKLNKSELKKLLQSELNIGCTKNPKQVDQMMKDLDADSDGEVDFMEFLMLVVVLTMLCNEFFTKGQTPCKK